MGDYGGSGEKGWRLGRVLLATAWMVASLGALPSPLQAQTIYHSEDKFSGGTVYNTERRDVDLEGGSFWTSRFVNFQFVAAKPTPNPDFPYTRLVVPLTRTNGWVFIESGASLVLKLDGSEMMPLVGNGSLNAREAVGGSSGDTVTEAAYYALTPEKLQRIAAAKSIEFRIVGDQQTITGTWHADLIADAAAFSAQAPQLLSNSAALPLTMPSGPYPSTANQSKPIFGVGFAMYPPQLATLVWLLTHERRLW